MEVICLQHLRSSCCSARATACRYLTDEGNEGNDSCEKHETCAKKPRT